MFRHRTSGQVVALAEDGTRFDSDGYVAHEDFDGQTWTATYAETDDDVEGYPIAPQGMAVQKKVSLDFSEWERVFGKDDTILEMHIPQGGPMTPEVCAESMQEGVRFFAEFFPEQDPAAIVCGSWLLNNQLEDILGQDSNLVKYQHELYLYPVYSRGRDGFFFIFSQLDFDPDTAPRDTRLQRGVLDFIAAGNRWRSGGMFMLVDDVGRIGQQVYRRNWPSEELGDLAIG